MVAMILNKKYLINILAAYPSFGFILDPNGTIESITGNIEQFFGLTSVRFNFF
jgi:hypothetical protein